LFCLIKKMKKMKRKILLSLTMIFVITLSLKSQTVLPVIHSKVDKIDIRNGDELSEGSWSLFPEAKPDIYTSNKIGEFVTFYTDLDSIKYKIHPDSVYNFVILLNGKDSAYTQIKYAPTYLDVLKGAEDYNNEKTNFPDFSYQDSSDIALKTLRTEFNLDSIAGGGNDVSRIDNKM